MAEAEAQDAAALLQKCTDLAHKLELQPQDQKLYIEFRRTVDLYSDMLRQSGEGVAAEELPSAVISGNETVDLDLRFLQTNALRSLARRHTVSSRHSAGVSDAAAGSGKEGAERVELTQAIMQSRTVSTGYMASAPPSQPLEHFFEVHRQTKSLLSGASERRVLHIDYARAELVFKHKEETTKSCAFDSLTAAELAGDETSTTVSVAVSGDAMLLRVPTRAEAAQLLWHVQRAMQIAGCRREGKKEPGVPSAFVRQWLLSGTVEKGGKTKWSSRWLVLTRSRLYILRTATSAVPLNVIALDNTVDVQVRQGQVQTFTIHTRERQFPFRTLDENNERWASTLREVCSATPQSGSGEQLQPAASQDLLEIERAFVDDDNDDDEAGGDEAAGDEAADDKAHEKAGGADGKLSKATLESLAEASEAVVAGITKVAAGAAMDAIPAHELACLGGHGLELPATFRAASSMPSPRETSDRALTKKYQSGRVAAKIRTLVSKEKRRFTEEGFNLDLTYITPRVIAMGFPSEGAEGVYRNPMSQVINFLERRHKEHYMVYNLCSERSYDPRKFDNRVEIFPFDDHNPPPLHMIPRLCQSLRDFLAEDEQNVVVLHCKAGKGRTGTMICAYLVYCHEFSTPEAALGWYGWMRTRNGKGVTIPSQRRYVEQVGKLMPLFDGGQKLPAATTWLKSLRLSALPNFDGKGGCEPYMKLHQGADVLLHSKRSEAAEGGGAGSSSEGGGAKQLSFDCKHLRLTSDFKVTIYDQDPSKKRKMLTFWLHPLFLGAGPGEQTLRLAKKELDGAASDKKHKKFDADFFVEVVFAGSPPAGEAPPAPSQGYASASDVDEEDVEEEEEELQATPRGGEEGKTRSRHASTSSREGSESKGGFLSKASKAMAKPMRHLVSKQKRRFTRDGFDLDLAYITERIIAMGFPSEQIEGVYRNPMSEVVEFLDAKHKERYMVYNLCSERSYDPGKFHNRVKVFPFDDHNPPPLRMMGEFCVSVAEHFEENPANIAVIHCKAGKGRTGVMISALMLHTRFFTRADEALDFYGFARTNDCEGVTIPSQRAYVHYYASMMDDPRLAERLRNRSIVYTLMRVRLVTLPHVMQGKDRGEIHLRLKHTDASKRGSTSQEQTWRCQGVVDEAEAAGLHLTPADEMGPPPPPRSSYLKPPGVPLAPEILNSQGEVVGTRARVPVVEFGEECSLPISSDFKVEVLHKVGRHAEEKLFSFWFHPAMLGDPAKLVLRKWQLDGANKDRKHKKYSPHFRVECFFREGGPVAAAVN